MSADRRHFLGWGSPEQPALAAAARWLIEHHGRELGQTVVALPGRRAGRRFLQLLTELLAGEPWTRPVLVTAGTLVDHLVQLDAPPASRLIRTCAWRHALEQEQGQLGPLLRRVPVLGDQAGWTQLASAVRKVHGELGGEAVDMDDVLADEDLAAHPSELERWIVLARVQEVYRSILSEAGRLDPHDARRAAIDAGRFTDVSAVVLIGIAELSGLARRALVEFEDRSHFLVAAPDDLASTFDAMGAVVDEAWSGREPPVDTARWAVAMGPGEVAEELAVWLQTRCAGAAPTEITVGLANPELATVLTRRLDELGVPAHDPTGTPLGATEALGALGAMQAFVEEREWREFGSLLRHPAVEAALVRACPDLVGDPVSLLDGYHGQHLPGAVGERWCSDKKTSQQVAQLYTALEELLGALGGPLSQTLRNWSTELRELLGRMFAGRDLSEEGRSRRPLAEELRELVHVLDELAEVPDELSPKLSSHEALAEVANLAAEREIAPPADDLACVELLGWLELALDDAPRLCITGLNEGSVPEAPGADPFLPDRLRARLGLVHDRRREARDRYVFELCLRSRPDHQLIHAKLDTEGEPLLPSRLLLAAEPATCAARARHAFADRSSRAVTSLEPAPAYNLPWPQLEALESISVTDFKPFLQAPYQWVLQRALRLDERDDLAQELDPRLFGNLAHDVLEHFGKSELTATNDEGLIHDFLMRDLGRIVERQFGNQVLPAVLLQVEQLRLRFELFAAAQAARAEAGWRVEHTEWSPQAGGVWFGEGEARIFLKGRIDRIDRKGDEWALIDYKTGDKAKVGQTHKDIKVNKGEPDERVETVWSDLQLPLYRHLVRELVGDCVVHFGYATLGKDAASVGFELKEWSDVKLKRADEQAADIIAMIRRNDAEELTEVGDWKGGGPGFEAILGAQLVALSTAADDEQGEGFA